MNIHDFDRRLLTFLLFGIIDDQTTFDTNTGSHPGLQLAKPYVLEDSEPEIDVVMMDNVETRVNGLVGIDQQSQVPILQMSNITTSRVSADTPEDVMELDQQVNEEDVNGDDVYTDFDMDAPTDEDGRGEDIVISTESGKEMEKIPATEEKQPESEKVRILDARHLRASIPRDSPEPLLQEVVAPDILGKNVVVEGANLSTSVPEQGKCIEKLVDPAKVCKKTTLPTHPFYFYYTPLL